MKNKIKSCTYFTYLLLVTLSFSICSCAPDHRIYTPDTYVDWQRKSYDKEETFVDDEDYETPMVVPAKLVIAARTGSITAIDLLLEKGGNINEQDSIGRTPLYAAVVGLHIEVVAKLIHYGANVNLANNYGMTPLMYAAGMGNKSLVELLLASNADPLAVSGEDMTALDYAKFQGHKEVAKAIEEFDLADRDRVLKKFKKFIANNKTTTLDKVVRDSYKQGYSNLCITDFGECVIAVRTKTGEPCRCTLAGKERRGKVYAHSNVPGCIRHDTECANRVGEPIRIFFPGLPFEY